MRIKRLIVVVGSDGFGQDRLEHPPRPALRRSDPLDRLAPVLPRAGHRHGAATARAAAGGRTPLHRLARGRRRHQLRRLRGARLACLERLYARHGRVIAVGSSGTLRAGLCARGWTICPQADEGAPRNVDAAPPREDEGTEALAEELRHLDPAYYEQVARRNPARVVRALEICLQTGRPYSEQRTGPASPNALFGIVKIGVDLPARGLTHGSTSASRPCSPKGSKPKRGPCSPTATSMRSGRWATPQFFDFFDGWISRDEAVEQIKRNSRRYAKRRLTWFRRDPQVQWFRPEEQAIIACHRRDIRCGRRFGESQ